MIITQDVHYALILVLSVITLQLVQFVIVMLIGNLILRIVLVLLNIMILTVDAIFVITNVVPLLDLPLDVRLVLIPIDPFQRVDAMPLFMMMELLLAKHVLILV